MVLCDNCGHDNKETAKFCHSCGTKIEITEPVPAPKSSRLFKIGRKSRQQELKEYEKKYPNEPEGKKQFLLKSPNMANALRCERVSL